jgi:hypothetical protein
VLPASKMFRRSAFSECGMAARSHSGRFEASGLNAHEHSEHPDPVEAVIQ